MGLTEFPSCAIVRIIMPGITIDNIYETTEAAKLLGISYATLYRRIKAGELTPIRIAGRTLIPKSEAERVKKEKAAEA